MNLIAAQEEVMCNIEAGNATMLSSGSGLGKSSILRQTFERLAASGAPGEWGYGQVFAATQNPISVIGTPYKGMRTFDLGNGETKTIAVDDPSVPLWMISDEGKPAFMYKRFFLVIDEYGQGEADTKRAFAEILLNGGTGYWKLPEGSVRVAATNHGSRYGVTKDFDFAIARRTQISVEGNVEVTSTYLDKPYKYQGRTWQTLPIIKSWINTPAGADYLFEKEPKEQGPWCNPRTLCAADRYLQVKMARNNGVIPTNDPVIMETLAGTIGHGAMTSLMNHFQFQLELPPYADVIKDPMGTELPAKADLKLLMVYEMAAKAKREDLSQVITYISRLPSEMNVTFVTALLRRDYKTLIGEPAMQAWISKNANMVSIIATLAH